MLYDMEPMNGRRENEFSIRFSRQQCQSHKILKGYQNMKMNHKIFLTAILFSAALPFACAASEEEETETVPAETVPADTGAASKDFEEWKKVGKTGITMLFQAAEDGDTAMIRYLVQEQKIDVHARNPQGWTALMFAAYCGRTDAVRLLAELGADVNARDPNTGKTPLMLAAETNSFPDTVKALGKLNADLTYRSGDGDGALSLAAKAGQTSVLSALIKAGCQPDEAFVNGKTALMLAAERGFFQSVRVLTKAGAKVDAKDANGDTALALVILDEQTKINKMLLVRFLIRQGANPNAKNRSGRTPLMQAAMTYFIPEMALFLIRSGADMNLKDEGDRNAEELARLNGKLNTADALKELMESGLPKEKIAAKLLAAAAKGRAKQIAALLKEGVAVNTPDSEGNTPLHLAAASGKADALKLLVNAGANVNARNQKDRTVLMCAAAEGSASALKALIKAGADVNALSKDGRTALMEAVRANRPEMIAPLIKAGALIGAKDNEGIPVLVHAVLGESPQSVRILLENGIDPKSKSADGHSALMTAMLAKITRQHRFDIVSLLLAKGADPNDADRFGNSALFTAILSDDLPLIRLLCRSGADVNTADRFGNTALMRATADVEMTRILLRYGADIKKRNSRGKTAYEVAKENERSESSMLLYKLTGGQAAEEDPSLAKLSDREKELRAAFARVAPMLNAPLMDDPAIDKQKITEKYQACTKLMKDFEDLKDTKAYKKIEAFRKKQLELLRNLKKE